MSLLSIRNLSVAFRTDLGLSTVVEAVDLDVEPGEIVAVVGESGSGKSVSMLAVLGLLPWTARVTVDSITFDGHDVLALSERKKRALLGNDLSMIFQEPTSSLNPSFTIGWQMMEMLAQHTDLPHEARQAEALSLLDKVGIPSPKRCMASYPHELSGGMNQRVMIAMMISCHPKLLIADEPTTALDVSVQAQILDILRDLRELHGMSILLITHDMGVVAEMADRVIVQYAGRQVEKRPVLELFESPRHPYTKALLSSLPENAHGDHLPSIPGTIPSPRDWPSGCVFHPRCSLAQEVCRGEAPVFAQGVACYYPLPASQEEV